MSARRPRWLQTMMLVLAVSAAAVGATGCVLPLGPGAAKSAVR